MTALNHGSQKSWTRFRFDDLIENVTERAMPSESDSATYVGLEHLSSDTLTPTTGGSKTALKGEKIRVKPGDVLFARRNPHLRRVGVAQVEGLFSAHGMALRTKNPLILLQEFLPHFVASSAFMDRVNQIAVGSLSKTVNWRDLAKQEFPLPPLDEQKRIVEAMALAAGVRRQLETVLRANDDVIEALLHELAWCRSDSLEPLIEAYPGELFDGDWIESKDQSPSGIRLLQLADIGSGRFLDKSDRFVSRETAVRLRCSLLRPGDLLISRMADPIGRACEVPEQIGDAITAVDVCVARSECSADERAYWIGLFNSSRWRSQCEAQAGGSTRTRISRRKLEQIPVPSQTTAERERLGRALISAQQLGVAQRRSLDGLVAVSRTLAGSSPDDRSGGWDVQ